MAFQFHHAESAASIASSSADDGGPMGDTGIKLPPGAEVFQVEVAKLHPTQLAVGMQQVGVKAAKARKKAAKGPEVLDAWLRARPIPVVLGPGKVMYLIDHHHLARALHECGIKTCYAGVAKDLSALDEAAFWEEMARAGCLWHHDHRGSELGRGELVARLPKTVADLPDDPYRSLAALVRKAGGYQKSTRPFAEFLWANYLRPRVPLVLAATGDVVQHVDDGVGHATSQDAAHLPGHTPTPLPREAQPGAAAAQGPAASAAAKAAGGAAKGTPPN